MQKFLSTLKEYSKSRLFLVFAAFVVLFFVIVIRLFSLQIVHGEQSLSDLSTSITRTLSISASRGNIYDRYGRPLAENQAAYSVRMDDSVSSAPEDRTALALALVRHLNAQGTPPADTLPLSATLPRTFLLDSAATQKWLSSLGLRKKELTWDAATVYDWLLQKYNIPAGLSETETRQTLQLCLELSDRNLVLGSVLALFAQNGDAYADELPISREQPYTFTMGDSPSREKTFKTDIGLTDKQMGYTAPEVMDYLYELFDIPASLPETLRRDMASLRYSLYLERWRKYQPVTLARNVSSKTLATLEENQQNYPGVTIDAESLRVYPYGAYFSHILGYIRKISESEYDTYKDYGYGTEAIVGKSGVEKLCELSLSGKDGEMLVEVDSLGRRISAVETVAPVSGDDVYLTLDADLQVAAYNALEEQLITVLKNRLLGRDKNAGSVTLTELFCSMVNSNNISVPQILSAPEGSASAAARSVILTALPHYAANEDEDYAQAKQALCTAIETGRLSAAQCVYILYNQGKFSNADGSRDKLKSGQWSALSLILSKLDSRELLPADTNLDPCSGSVVVTDVNTGELLACVTYPSYDNNQLVNTFNNTYWNQLLNDPTTPLVNRALSQKKAPGSTLKMAVAVAALETGTITPATLIDTEGRFTKAGTPYANCWIYNSSGGNHGTINVSHALEVSCNYFFYESVFRMGNKESGGTQKAIETLGQYWEAFGLNSPTGLEIDTSTPSMATPAYKEYITKMQNPEATETQTRWTDGDTIRAAIGQSVNNFSPAQMAKYIATLANGGSRYTMHLLDRIENAAGEVVQKTEPVVESQLDISQSTLNAVTQGMYLVSTGSKGTLRNVFADFPIPVASKSGTAEEGENRSSHVWYVGYAPFDDPQIAVTVMIPYGDAASSPSAQAGKEVIASYLGLYAQPETGHYLESSQTR